MFEQLADELDISFKKTGELTIAKNEDELNGLKELKKQGDAIGIPAEIIDKDKLQSMESNVTRKAIAALYVSTAGIILPFEMTIAFTENAAQNGVKVLIDTKVIDISKMDGENTLLVKTTNGFIKTKFVINAAGLFADEIARMIGEDDFSISPHKGEEYLLDKRVGNLINRPIFPVTPWILVIPTTDGNIMLGTTYTKVDDKVDLATTPEGFKKIISFARDLIPAISAKDIIRSFAGLRAMNTRTDDYIIEASKKEPKFINVVLGSPGITSAPAVAKMVVEILNEQGLKLTKKKDFNPYRKRIPRFSELPDEEKKALIKKDPRYSHVVCRCETVT
jgi:glycerol-3-phosphate dehydrogenase